MRYHCKCRWASCALVLQVPTRFWHIPMVIVFREPDLSPCQSGSGPGKWIFEESPLSFPRMMAPSKGDRAPVCREK
eukprot:scaffold211138_cov39-Tisochrysis_lutea.AAC.1